MEKSEFRMLIKHYFLRGKTITETKTKLDKYYPDSFPSIGTIHKWFTEFKCGRTSTETIPSPGRPIEVTTPEMIGKIHDLVLDEPKIKVREIVKAVNVSYERVVNILHNHLNMNKLCARWVPRSLSIHEKRIRVTTSKRNLALFNRNPNEFLRRIITTDETWIHFYTHESSQQSKEWTKRGETPPKRPKTPYY
ncbi:histone-lysine N-methyltransferase SETMAR-like [Sitodiplosis mosellana]|uniref:histone-lysine N-methyltransferase SETMAR-like n=1 Tax=Sitodiplosis mosellana TaxID=263140 RepID=UPI002443A497|nr:histone-lysine N-methyltransferase SETMAR-like [Sitodiplosis mosellana]